MKKIGFIDYYLNEWHADNYPKWLKTLSEGEYEVAYAYGEIDCPFDGSLTNAQWCEKQGVELVSDIHELVEKSDCLVVLAPDNCEKHLALALPAVASGKPVYVDKTFANSKAEAEEIFATAQKSGSPCFSASAFRCSQKLGAVKTEDINGVVAFGHLEPVNYLVHQIEPIVALMGRDVVSVMYTGCEARPAWQLRFADGRSASINMMQNEWKHYFVINHQDKNETIALDDDVFTNLMKAILEMFQTGKEFVAKEDTIAIMAIREKCLQAMDKPFEWLDM